VILVGSERTLVIDAHRPRLEVYAAEPPWTPPPAHPGDPMAFWDSTQAEVGTQPRRAWLPIFPVDRDVRCFLDALDAGQDGEVNAAEAARTTAVLLAAYRSAATGEAVFL
jgi:myo-inositol 2-dehydrogenase / D-chiro-inositol 1-dehydrogenase